MAWAPITLQAGMNAELTPTLNRAGFTLTGLGRFKQGLFQKLGGFTKFFPFQTAGIPKALHAWQDLAKNDHLAQGSTTALNVITAGTLINVTPQTFLSNAPVNFTTTAGSATVTVADTGISNITNFDAVFFNTPVSVGGIILSGLYQVSANIGTTIYQFEAQAPASSSVSNGGAIPAFSTTLGSSLVTVTLPAHGLAPGSDIVFPTPTTIGGLTVSGRMIVQSVADSDNFTVTAPNAATSAAGPVTMNGGNAQFFYWIAIGPQALSGGYGTSTYGAGGYGTGVPIAAQPGTDITATDWSLDNFGELLISNPENGPIFTWGPASGFANSSPIATGPAFATGAFVSIAQEVIVAYGATVEAAIGVFQDPLQVQWSSVGDITDWNPTVINQAGTYRLTSGSRIVGGCATSSIDLIFTDLDVWSMSYIGSTFAFGFLKIGDNCGLIAKHAHAQLAGATYWMSPSGFFATNGGSVAPLPCSVWDAVFQDLDTANADQCFAGSNTLFNEVIFFFPSKSGGLGICDKYAKLNTLDGSWDYGSLQRNTWIDQSVLGNPIASTNTGTIYTHESGTDADGQPLNAFFETGWFYIDEGEELVMINRIIPDFKWGTFSGPQSATVMITVRVIEEMGDTPRVFGPFPVTQATKFISKKFRGRQVQFRVESNDIGSFWRLGHVRLRYKLDGRK